LHANSIFYNSFCGFLKKFPDFPFFRFIFWFFRIFLEKMAKKGNFYFFCGFCAEKAKSI